MMRACGGCIECCWAADVPELLKAPHHFCPELTREKDGCRLFGKRNRPKVCRAFGCAWLREMLPEEDRPDKIGAMFSLNFTGRGVVAFAIETAPHAFHTTARDALARMARRVNCPVIATRHESKPPDDKGDWVVVKDELVEKCHAIAGEKLFALDGVSVFRFRRAA